jgi:signal transduction histidine kinase
MAFAVVGMMLIVFAALAPFARMQLAPLDSFLPTAQSVIVITSFIGSVLLFGQFVTIGLSALLVLAAGYLFVALIVVAQTLTFPGAFTPTGLFGAGAQSSGWLYFAWHFGFPTAVIGYVLIKDTTKPFGVRNFPAIFWTVTIVIWVVLLLTWTAIAGAPFLPVLFVDGARFSRFTFYVTGADLVLTALTIALLNSRGRSTLDMWLTVTSCAFLAELLINTLLIPGRFTLGWYAGRAFSILVSTIVMTLILMQTFKLNAKLMRITILLQRERANKLANLEAVVGSISHEVRQPLSAISMQGVAAQRWLRRSSPNLIEVEKSIGGMIDSVMRAGEILDNIRSLFSNVVQEMQPVDVNRLITEALDTKRDEIRNCGIDVGMQLSPQLPLITANSGLLREVFVNLIQNAIDAMKAVADRRRLLEIKADHHGDEEIVVSVEDTGPGIEPEKVSSIFEPFFSTKAKGMGLGLAICRSIVERHQGQLSVRSEIGSGTRFQLALPVKQTAQRELRDGIADLRQFSNGALLTNIC